MLGVCAATQEGRREFREEKLQSLTVGVELKLGLRLFDTEKKFIAFLLVLTLCCVNDEIRPIYS